MNDITHDISSYSNRPIEVFMVGRMRFERMTIALKVLNMYYK